MVWDFPILRGPLRHQGRRTTVRLLRAMLGLGGPFEAVVGVDPGCTSRGSVGGQHPRLEVGVGVGVSDRCSLRAPLTLGMLCLGMALRGC